MYTNEEEKNKKKTEEQTGTQEQTADTQEQTTTDGATTPPVAPASTTQPTGETTPAQATTPETIATPTTTTTTTTTPPTTEGANANGSKETATPPVTTESIAEGVAAQTAKEDAEYDAWLAQQTADMDSYLNKEDSIGNQVKEEAEEEHKDFDAFWQQKMAESDAAAKEAIEELDNAEKAELEKMSEDLEKASEWNQLDLENKRLDAITQQLTKARDEIKKKDEVAQKRGRSLALIAGISDGLSALANLVGTAKGGLNIDLGEGAITPLVKKLEEARKERKGDIKSIDDRLDQISNQQLQMRLAKYNREQAQAQADLQHERTMELQNKNFANQVYLAQLEAAEAEKLLGIKMENESLNRAAKAERDSFNNAVKMFIAEVKAANGGRSSGGRQGTLAVVDITSGGQTTRYQVPRVLLNNINNNADLYIITDVNNGVAETQAAYEEYRRVVGRGNVTAVAKAAAKKKLLNASPTYRQKVAEAAGVASNPSAYTGAATTTTSTSSTPSWDTYPES